MLEPGSVLRGRSWIAGLALTALHGALVLHGASRHSATVDEVVYPAAGYARLVSRQPDVNVEHPPLGKLLLGAAWLGARLPALDAVPGLSERDEWDLGRGLLYADPGRAPALLLRARIVVAVASMALCLGIFAVASLAFGSATGVLAVALYALDPLAIGHAGLATLDVLLAATLFAAAFIGWRALETGRAAWIGAAGLALGVALAVKVSAVVLVPALLVVAVAPRLARQAAGVPWRRLLAVLAIGAAVLTVLCLPEGPRVWWRAFDEQRKHNAAGHFAFAFGLRSSTGWWWYYPAAWLVKTPIPALAASATGAVLLAARGRRTPALAAAVLGVPALLFAAALQSHVCIGVRQVLPAVPFLAIAGGYALSRLAREWRGQALAAGLLLWLGIGVARVHPSEIAYANEAAGGPTRLHRLLADSNVDWGQGIPDLADFLRGVRLRRLWLDYFGTGLPAAHGVPDYRLVRGLGFGKHPRRDGASADGKELLAVSLSNLEDAAEDAETHAWLRGRPPMALPGYSIAVFDITDDPVAYEQLARMSERRGDFLTAEEAWRRRAELVPGDVKAVAAVARSPSVIRDVEALLAEVDRSWERRDETGELDGVRARLARAAEFVPRHYGVLWRLARYYSWLAEDLTIDGQTKADLGHRAWVYGDQARELSPRSVEGHFYAAAGIANYSLGIGMMRSFAAGLEAEFKERLARAGELAPTYAHGTMETMLGRLYFVMPWPKYDAVKSEALLRKALSVNPANVRSRVYLAELYRRERRPEEASALLEETVARAPGAYDAPDERRWLQRAKELLAGAP